MCDAVLRAKSFQLYLTLRDPMDYSSPVSSVHGIIQARIVEWVVMPFSRGFFPTQGWKLNLLSPALADGFFTTSTTWEAPERCH